MPVRGGTTALGYGRQHQLFRRSLAEFVGSGLARCARCGERIAAGAPWDLGHDDFDRSRYAGPEHRLCNQRGRRQHRRRVSRAW